MRLRVWVGVLGLFGVCHCANGLPLPRVDFGGPFFNAGPCGHLDNVQPLPTIADHYPSFTVPRVDEFRQTGVQFVDGGCVHGVDIHSGASFGIRLHRESHVLTPGEHRNRINCALSAFWNGSPITGKPETGHGLGSNPFRPPVNHALSLTLQSALYCAGPCLDYRQNWWRRVDLNHRPLGYEPSELPDCSTALESFVPHTTKAVKAFPAHWQAEPWRLANGGLPLT